jgi:hypothetical protein
MRKIILIVAAVIIAIAVGGVAAASVPDSSGIIHACRKTSNGALSVIDTARGQTCAGGDTALNWRQAGASGLQQVSNFQEIPNDTTLTDVTLTASCPSGYKAVGGGFQTPGPRDTVGNFWIVLQSRPAGVPDSTGWFVYIHRIGPNDSGNTGIQPFEVWAQCLPTTA